MKTLSYFKYFSISLFIFVLTGCATSMKMTSLDLNNIAPNEGIIIGSLNVSGGDDILGRVDWVLTSKNDNDSTFLTSKKYSIAAKRDKGEEVFVSKLPAGNYTFYLLTQPGFSSFKAEANFSFTVQPGKSVYIGRMLVKFSPGSLTAYSKIYYGVEDARNDDIGKAKDLYSINLNNVTTSLVKIDK